MCIVFMVSLNRYYFSALGSAFVLEKDLLHFCCSNFVISSLGATLTCRIVLIQFLFTVFSSCFENTVKSNTVSRYIDKFQP